MIFSEEDLLEIFSADAIAAAKSYVDQAATPNVQREGEVISSLVRTQAAPAKPFRVYIRVLSTPRGGVEFHGECSCHTGRNCSHVLLVLLAALAAETSAGTTAVTGHAASTSGSHPVPGPQLIYILDQADSLGWAGALKVSLYTARRLAAGGFGRTAAFRVSEAVLRQPPGFIDANDRKILNLLPRDGDGTTAPLPASARGLAILEHVLASGRCFHQAPSATPLALGETRQATADWTLDEPGNQSFTLRCDSPATTLFLRPAPCYLDQASDTVGRLKTALPDSVLSMLADQPPVAPEAVAQTRAHLALQFPGLPLPELAELTIESVDPDQPVPRLRLYRPDTAAPLHGDLSFDYAGITLTRDSRTRIRRGNRVFDVKRNAGWEEHCRARLAQAGLSPEITDPRWTFATSVGPAHEQRFLLLELPRLLSEGWNVETATELGIRLAEADGWYGELKPGQSQDGFELDLGISIDGKRIPLLPALVTLIEAMPELLSRQGLAALDGETRLHAPLADGRLIPLPVKKLRRVLETLVELVEPDALNKSGRMVMNRWQAASLAELEADDDAAGWRWDGDEHWRELADRLRRIDAIPAVDPPQGLNATLRRYQQHGLDWLQFLSEFGFAGILADDMGLGKTLQTLAHILLEKERGRSSAPCLIVAPTSLLYNWRSEAKRFAPDLKTLILHGPQRSDAFDRIARHDLVITSYGLLLRDEAEHTRQRYHLLVLDEAQTMEYWLVHPMDRVVTIYRLNGMEYGKPDVQELAGETAIGVLPGVVIAWDALAARLPKPEY
ncbi:MAG: SNF2-related protein [Thiotrichales bacterium]